MSWFERAAIAAGFAYLGALGWAMRNVDDDLWGALVTGPILVLLTVPLVGRLFSGRLAPLQPLVWCGLAAKLAGAIVGYFVRSDLYGGAADANRYHDAGSALAVGLRSGDLSLLTGLPFARGTFLTEDITGVIYAIFGSSKLSGYFVFAWLSYVGLVLVLKAGVIAIPTLARKRYAILLFATPSLVYWGSSIGKEALVGPTLGLISIGVAIAIADPTRRRLGLALLATGVLTTAMVRPHFAAVWVGAAGIALAVRLIANAFGRRDSTRGDGSRIGALAMLGLAGVGFVFVSALTLNYLDPNDPITPTATAGAGEAVAGEAVTDRISQIFDKTEDRTSTGGSSLALVSTSNPLTYPYAAFRTLTRPLLFEARSLSQLLPAIEMTILLLIAARWWRRFASIPELALRNPYVVYGLVCVVTFGVAFASIGNLGILVRQRSLVFPLLLMFWCLPERSPRQATVPPLSTVLPVSTRRSQPAASNSLTASAT